MLYEMLFRHITGLMFDPCTLYVVDAVKGQEHLEMSIYRYYA